MLSPLLSPQASPGGTGGTGGEKSGVPPCTTKKGEWYSKGDSKKCRSLAKNYRTVTPVTLYIYIFIYKELRNIYTVYILIRVIIRDYIYARARVGQVGQACKKPEGVTK